MPTNTPPPDHAERFKRAQDGVFSNDPPIEVNQHWVAKNNEGEILRKIRILAKHPDLGWIVQDEFGKPGRFVDVTMKVCPEFNLRYVFELEA